MYRYNSISLKQFSKLLVAANPINAGALNPQRTFKL